MKRKYEGASFDQDDKSHPDPLAGPHTKAQKLEVNFNDEIIRVFDTSKPLVQIAPMLHVSHRHFRAFMRQLTLRAQLWTEMVVDSTIKYTAEPDRHLGFSKLEEPLVCQIGGCKPDILADACKVLEDYGYHEINLNVGCPSERVADAGAFGAMLMKDPPKVRDLCTEIRKAITVPLSVKTRIAVDDLDSLEWCSSYIKTLAESGVSHYIMHARPAWLNKKLSPSQNRSIPPLNYDRVFELVETFPELNFSINGGIQTLDEVERLLRIPHPHHPGRSALIGCMMGRAAMDKPAFLYDVDRRIYGDKSNPNSAESRYTVLQGYIDYLSEYHKANEENTKAQKFVFPQLNPCTGLFHSTRASKFFRQTIDTQVRKHASTMASHEILQSVVNVMEACQQDVLHAPLDTRDEAEEKTIAAVVQI